MVYDSNSRGGGRGDWYDREGRFDYGRDYGTGRDYTYSSARDYQAAGRSGDDRGERGGHGYGGNDRDGGIGFDREQPRYGDRGGYARGGDDRGDYRQGGGYGSHYGGRDYSGPRYGAGGRERPGGYRPDDRGSYRGEENRDRGRDRGYGAQPQGYQYEDRGFFDRAGDEVRSWFGDDEAERRREMDQRYDERADRGGRVPHDEDYHSWRSGQIAALDRDYDDYRRENRSRFEQEFSTWRTGRQGQRDLLKQVKEHAEVVGSDGQHVGTVDKVKGDRIVLTKNDQDAGGHHHSIPSSWLASVDDKVTLSKSAAEAKQAWEDEDRDAASSRNGNDGRSDRSQGERAQGDRNLNKSFKGTY